MKIIAKTNDLLVTKEKNSLGYIFGPIFTILGIVLMYYFFIKNVSVSPDDNTVFRILSVSFTITGIYSMLFGSTIIVKINKLTGQIEYEKSRLIGKKTTIYEINNVLQIELRSTKQIELTSSTDLSSEGALCSQTIILFKDGLELPFNYQTGNYTRGLYVNILDEGRGKDVVIANEIATFLNVPLKDFSPNNLLGMDGVNV